jgi:hypothetical protein
MRKWYLIPASTLVLALAAFCACVAREPSTEDRVDALDRRISVVGHRLSAVQAEYMKPLLNERDSRWQSPPTEEEVEQQYQEWVRLEEELHALIDEREREAKRLQNSWHARLRREVKRRTGL